MADHLSTYRTSYYKYENGETAPQITSLYKLGKDFKISMDWLILNRGPMHFEEKQVTIEKEIEKTEPLPPAAPPAPPAPPSPPPAPTLSDIPGKDLKDLLFHMEHIPLLRYEVLVLFFKFKEEHKGMVEALKLS